MRIQDTGGRQTDTRMDKHILDTIEGAREACDRVRGEAARDALCGLLEAARQLGLNAQCGPWGKQQSVSFGPYKYPVCRVNTTKGIAFHVRRNAAALIIETRGDEQFRLATRVLRRLALSLSLDE